MYCKTNFKKKDQPIKYSYSIKIWINWQRAWREKHRAFQHNISFPLNGNRTLNTQRQAKSPQDSRSISVSLLVWASLIIRAVINQDSTLRGFFTGTITGNLINVLSKKWKMMDDFTQPWIKCDTDTNTHKEMKLGSVYVCAASQTQFCSSTDNQNINLQQKGGRQKMRETKKRHEKKDEDEMEINNGCFGDGTSERGRLGKKEKDTGRDTLHLLIMSWGTSAKIRPKNNRHADRERERVRERARVMDSRCYRRGQQGNLSLWANNSIICVKNTAFSIPLLGVTLMTQLNISMCVCECECECECVWVWVCVEHNQLKIITYGAAVWHPLAHSVILQLSNLYSLFILISSGAAKRFTWCLTNAQHIKLMFSGKCQRLSFCKFN